MVNYFSGQIHVLAAGTYGVFPDVGRNIEAIRQQKMAGCVRYLLEGPLMHTCASAKVQQLCCR